MAESQQCSYCLADFTTNREPLFINCCASNICMNCYNFIARKSPNICLLCLKNHDFHSHPLKVTNLVLPVAKSRSEKELEAVMFNGLLEKLSILREIKKKAEETRKILKKLEETKEITEKCEFPDEFNENELNTLDIILEYSIKIGINEFMKIKENVESLISLNLEKFERVFIERNSLLLKQRLINKNRLLWTSKKRMFKIVESSGDKVFHLKLMSKIPVYITGIGLCTKYQQEPTGNNAKVIVKIGTSVYLKENIDLNWNSKKDNVTDVCFDNPIELKPYQTLIIEMSVIQGKYFTLDPFEIARYKGHFFTLSSNSVNHLAYFMLKNDTAELILPRP